MLDMHLSAFELRDVTQDIELGIREGRTRYGWLKGGPQPTGCRLGQAGDAPSRAVQLMLRDCNGG